MTHVLPRLSPTVSSVDSGGAVTDGALGLYLGLTGVRLMGDSDLTFCGLATHGVASAQVGDLVNALVALPSDSTTGSSLTAAVAEVLDRFSADAPAASSGEAGAGGGGKLLGPNLPAIARCFGPQHSSVESVVAALEAEEGNSSSSSSEWAAKTLKALHSVSPTALKVTFKLLRDHGAADVSFSHALANEFTVCQRCMRPGGKGKSDLYEGIRGVLVDKGKPPARWEPATIGEVSQEAVDEFFAPLESQYRLEF